MKRWTRAGRCAEDPGGVVLVTSLFERLCASPCVKGVMPGCSGDVDMLLSEIGQD